MMKLYFLYKNICILSIPVYNNKFKIKIFIFTKYMFQTDLVFVCIINYVNSNSEGK